MAQKTTQNRCVDCHFFDDSKHRNDPRTVGCGICMQYFNVQFKTDKICKGFMALGNPKEWDELTKPKNNQILEQLSLS